MSNARATACVLVGVLATAAMPVAVTALPSQSSLVAPLRALVALIVKAERRKLGEVAVVLTDDSALRILNREWRGIDRATDVISFAYDEDEPDAALGRR